MINFPFCKINLGLRVINKRNDGYHNIETCFYPVPWKDVLEIIRSNDTKIFLTGIEIQGEAKSNLVFRAYQLLKQDFPIGSVEIHLHKIIPHGAGLGGGSSDAAHALKLLNELFELNIPIQKLQGYALKLGSDCPFFLETTPMMASGRGDVFTPISLSLSGLTLVIIKPDINVSTAEAYGDLRLPYPSVSLHQAHPDLVQILSQPIANWKGALKNDFEKSVFGDYPAIAEIKNKLYRLGAIYASMSGSGSSVFGIFENPIDLEKEFIGMDCWMGNL